MPTYNQYLSDLDEEATSLVGFNVQTRRDVDKVVAEARRRVIDKRNGFILDITKTWRQGFANIKQENDQMQKDLTAAYKAADQHISKIKGDLYEKVQK